MRIISLFLLLLLGLVSFAQSHLELRNHTPLKYAKISEIPCPEGYTRKNQPDNSFATYLRSLSLKQNNNIVFYHNRQPKHNQDAQFAVLTMDVGKRNLQQCADAVMRLRAEYLFAQGRKDEIHFNFVNGMRVNYTKYAAGHRMIVKGNKTRWVKNSKPDSTYRIFRRYMNLIFAYAGTASLVKELTPVGTMKDIQIGDVFIIGGSPGHAVIVVDVAINAAGQKIFMIAQSYMPAQDIHVLKNPACQQSPWYQLKDGEILDSPEYQFNSTDLRRF